MAILGPIAECAPENDRCCQASKWMMHLILPCILVLGTVGNILACTVLLRKEFRNKTHSIFLTALSAFDCIYLWAVIPRLLFKGLLDINLCKIVSSAVYSALTSMTISTQAMSLYLMAMIALERVIYIYFPFKARSTITKRKCILSVLVVTACTVTVRGAIVLGSVDHLNNTGNATAAHCIDTLEDPDESNKILANVSILVNFFIPFSVIVTGNVLIIRKLLTQNAACASSASALAVRNSATKTVVVITVVYLVTTSPFFSLMIFINYNRSSYVDDNAKIYLTQYILLLCMLGNHACNFLLYFWVGLRFREATRLLFRALLCNTPGSQTDRINMDNLGFLV